VPAVPRRTSPLARWSAAVLIGGLALAACDLSESARERPVDELDETERPYAAPLGALYAQEIPDGVRTTFDAECLGAAYIRGFGLDALVVPGADPATLTVDDLVQEAPADVDVDAFIDGVRACGDVRVYAALVGGRRWAQAPLSAEQLRCAGGRMDEARAARLLRLAIVVEDDVDESTRDDAAAEVVGHLRECGAAMSDPAAPPPT
jgi:hypothetical protein